MRSAFSGNSWQVILLLQIITWQYEFFKNISLLFYMFQSVNAKKIPKQMHI